MPKHPSGDGKRGIDKSVAFGHVRGSRICGCTRYGCRCSAALARLWAEWCNDGIVGMLAVGAVVEVLCVKYSRVLVKLF